MSDFETEWARCSPWIEAALAHANGTHDLADVKAAIDRGEATFWNGHRSAMVTEIHAYPKFTTFNFWLAGGDLDELRDVLRPLAEQFYAAQGCRYATITGRPGWARALGYRTLHHTCAKDLSL